MADKFPVFNMTLPAEGPQTVPVNVDMQTNIEQEIDLTALVDNGVISFVAGAWIDNSDNGEAVTLICNATNQRVIIPANSQGWYPLLSTNPPKFSISQAAVGDIVKLIFVNFPVWPSAAASSGGGGGGDVTITPPTFTDYSDTCDGTTKEFVAAGQASKYLYIQNYAYNSGTIIVDLAGGATGNGVELAPGGTIELENGVANAITIQGLADTFVIVYGGA